MYEEAHHTIRALLLSLVFASVATPQNNRVAARELAVEGWSKFNDNQLAEAEKLLGQAAALDPKQADYQGALGTLCAKEKRWHEAIAYLDHALRLAPGDAEFRIQLAQAWQALDQDTKALTVLQSQSPPASMHNVWTFTSAFSSFRLRRYSVAQAGFESLLSDSEFSAPANFFLGNILYAEDKLPEAAHCFEVALERGDRPDNPAYNAYAYDFGLTLYRMRNFPAAASAFEKSIARFSNDPLPWLWLGRSKQELGDFQGAISDLEQSIRINPDFRLSYFQLARLQQQHGDKQRAAELFEKINAIKQSERDADERAASLPKVAGPQ